MSAVAGEEVLYSDYRAVPFGYIQFVDRWTDSALTGVGL
jgi:hypothetical protein